MFFISYISIKLEKNFKYSKEKYLPRILRVTKRACQMKLEEEKEAGSIRDGDEAAERQT